MTQIKCQYAEHNEQQCPFICIDINCIQKRVSCFQCFQDKNYHFNHQGLTIEEFQQKVRFRLDNLRELQLIIETSKELFNQFIQSQVEFINIHIQEGEKYLQIQELNKVFKIRDYYRYEQDNIAPFVQQQLFKIQRKIDKSIKFIESIKYLDKKANTKEINDLKKKAMDVIKDRNQNCYQVAIKYLNQGLKLDPTNCSLISLKCTCLTNINQNEKAQRLINYAFQINQNDETVLLFLAKLRMKEKQYEKCLDYYELSNEANQYLAYFKLDSLKKLNQNQKYHVFKQECSSLFGNDFHQNYEKHLEASYYD